MERWDCGSEVRGVVGIMWGGQMPAELTVCHWCTRRAGVDCESARVVLEVLRGGIASCWASFRGVYLEWPVAECEPIVLQDGLWYIVRVGKPNCGVYVCHAGQSVSVRVMSVVARSGCIVYARREQH